MVPAAARHGQAGASLRLSRANGGTSPDMATILFLVYSMRRRRRCRSGRPYPAARNSAWYRALRIWKPYAGDRHTPRRRPTAGTNSAAAPIPVGTTSRSLGAAASCTRESGVSDLLAFAASMLAGFVLSPHFFLPTFVSARSLQVAPSLCNCTYVAAV